MTDDVRSDRVPPTSPGIHEPYEATYDLAPTECPSTAIVRGIATVTGVEPARLEPPLYEIVDPQAVDRLFAQRHDGSERAGGAISLRYGQFSVRIDATEGRIHIAEAASGDDP